MVDAIRVALTAKAEVWRNDLASFSLRLDGAPLVVALPVRGVRSGEVEVEAAVEDFLVLFGTRVGVTAANGDGSTVVSRLLGVARCCARWAEDALYGSKRGLRLGVTLGGAASAEPEGRLDIETAILRVIDYFDRTVS